MHHMTGQTPDLSIKEGEVSRLRGVRPSKRDGIDRMMVIAVMVTVKAYGGGIYPFGERISLRNIGSRHPVTEHARGMIFVEMII